MGTKPCKPVVPFEDVKDRLKPIEYEHLRRSFLLMSGGASYDAAVPKDRVKEWLGKIFSEYGTAVLNRFFEAIDTDGNRSVNFKEYMQAAFIFSAGTRSEKIAMVFAMFDLGGNGAISRKDFKKMSTAFIVGDRPTTWTFTRRSDDDFKAEETETADLSFFKPLTELMVDVALLEYGRENESKLTLEDFQQYAEQDQDVSRFVDLMAKLVPKRPR